MSKISLHVYVGIDFIFGLKHYQTKALPWAHLDFHLRIPLGNPKVERHHRQSTCPCFSLGNLMYLKEVTHKSMDKFFAYGGVWLFRSFTCPLTVCWYGGISVWWTHYLFVLYMIHVCILLCEIFKNEFWFQVTVKLSLPINVWLSYWTEHICF